MISRPPILIYKPYCCIVSSSIYQLPFWSQYDRRRFNSTLLASYINRSEKPQEGDCHCRIITKPKLSTIDMPNINLDLFDAAKFIGTLNSETIQKSKQQYLSLNVYRPLLFMEKFDKKLLLTHRFAQTLNEKQYMQGNLYRNRLELLQDDLQADHVDQCQEKLYWEDRTKPPPKKIKNNDLPSEEQLDEMMYYFHEQAPKLFSHTGWSYNKCSYKIIFENMMLGSKTETLNAYIMQINVMKNVTRLVLSNPELSIMRMTKDIENGSLQIRWQVQGVPRYLLPFYFLGLLNEKRSARYIDGFSIFYVKDDGLYHRHLLLKMTPLQNEMQRTPLSQIFPEFHGIYTPPLRPSLEVSTDKK